jgi:menaquinol-cytochrome c reductase iron-sulfur subunit
VESRALRTVWLYTEDGEHFTAYSGTCTHLGCSFGYDKDRDVFACPCHRGLFDVKTGKVLGGPPPRPLDTLPVKVENGEVHVMFESFRTGIEAKVAV